MQRAVAALLAVLLSGCAMTAGVGRTPEGTAWYEGRDPQFVLMAEPNKDATIKPFFLHISSITDRDYRFGTNVIGISARFSIGQWRAGR